MANVSHKAFSLEQIASWTSDTSEVNIPALQRGLVWKPQQVELLWDSILLGVPSGSFLLSDIPNKEGKYYLMDGQQRYNAISIGFNTVPDARAVLWIDLKPPKVQNSTRIFWIKATTIPHPWGFKNNDESSRLNTDERRRALEKFDLHGNIYQNSFSLKSTWPIESNCPVPLWCFLKASSETDNPETFLLKVRELFQNTDFEYRKRINIDDIATEYVNAKLFPAFSALKSYRINCNHLQIQTIEAETTNDSADQPTALETLFTRLNTGGTQISQDDLNYSAIKAYWPTIKESNDRLAEKYMHASKLVMLAFRLALTEDVDKELKNELSIKQIRNYAQNEKEREKIIRLYNEGILEKILCKIDDWLGVNDNNEQHTPSILRTIIARNSPDVYLLLMYFAFKNLESPIDLTAKEIKALAFVLHWFNANKSQKGCAQEIFSRCREAINKNNIKMGLAYLMHDCKLLHIYSPSEVREFIKIKENRDWRIWQNIHAPARQFFDRIFRYKNSETKEMLLYAERKYLNTHFSNYDPARQDLWEEYNRPWDFDHIVAKNKIVGKWGPYREYDKIWLNSIGNIAAISYESNRSKNAGENYIEYHLNRDTLLYDDAVENLDCNLTKSDKASFDFARITYKRFCNIYTDIYEVIKPLLADTELTGTLKRRKDIIDAVTNHFTDAVVHFAAFDQNDYVIERDQDWAREWIGVGIKRGPYMACFEWNAQIENEKPGYTEIGIRKSLGTIVTKENAEALLNIPVSEDSLNTWWYLKEDCPSLEIDHIIERLNYFLSIIPVHDSNLAYSGSIN